MGVGGGGACIRERDLSPPPPFERNWSRIYAYGPTPGLPFAKRYSKMSANERPETPKTENLEALKIFEDRINLGGGTSPKKPSGLDHWQAKRREVAILGKPNKKTTMKRICAARL